jgi:hypothetical protein
MNAIRIRTTVDSETLHLPELRPLVGRTVEIIVLDEESAADSKSGATDWDDAMRAVDELQDYDFDALRRQRECDLQHAKDHLP